MKYVSPSLLIIFYITLTLTAGFSGLFNLPFKRFFYPWDNFGMFARPPVRHYEIIARGTRNNGEAIILSLQEFFPMSPVLIERGQGLAVSAVTQSLQGIGRDHATSRLCAYLLRRHNELTSDPLLKLRTLDIKFLSWPLEGNNKMTTEELLTRCS